MIQSIPHGQASIDMPSTPLADVAATPSAWRADDDIEGIASHLAEAVMIRLASTIALRLIGSPGFAAAPGIEAIAARIAEEMTRPDREDIPLEQIEI